MSSKSLSIKQRLLKAKSPQAKAMTVTGWAEAWQAEQLRILADLKRAERACDWDAVAGARSQLEESCSKRFAALPGVLTHLLGYEAGDEPEVAP